MREDFHLENPHAFCFCGCFRLMNEAERRKFMGVWLRAKGRLEVVPQPDNQLLVDFWIFSKYSWPEYYAWKERVSALCESENR